MGGTFQLAVHLFLQLAVILAACRLVGRLLRPLGQTQVVSEMVAGVLLGPSVFGLLAPKAQQHLFPTTQTLAAGSLFDIPRRSIFTRLRRVPTSLS